MRPVVGTGQHETLTLDKLVAMVNAAREGDGQAGQQAWQLCAQLATSDDAAMALVGKALRDILIGVPPQTALASLPDDLRQSIIKAFV